MKIEQFKYGLTIRELKRYVKNLPEVDEYGDLYEVWLDNGDGTSSIVKVLCPLNHGDLLIERECYD